MTETPFQTKETTTDQACEVINIIKFENEKPVLDKEALEQILLQPEVVDLPIALYSIAGPYRTGKSFLFNLFVRFMKNKELTELDKPAYNDDVIDGPFEFQGGPKGPCTRGIFMLKKPYYIHTEENNIKAVAFLMDTQGMFDHETATESIGNMLGLSFLLSSFQFFNLQNKIDASYLQYLYKFGDFAMKLKHECQCDSPFQALRFFVRDWYYIGDHNHGLEGGKDYLRDCLKIESQRSSEHERVRVFFEDTFTKLDCFLLPPPGDSVQSMKSTDRSCNRKGMKSNFLSNIEILFKQLSEPNEVVLKMIKNQTITCRQLYHYAVQYDELMRSGQVDEVQSFVQAGKKAEVEITVHESLSFYCKEMKNVVHDEENPHKKIKGKAMAKFTKNITIADEELIEYGQTKLKKLIKEEFEDIKLRNEMKQARKECVEYYTEKMNNFIRDDDPDLKQVEDKHCELQEQSIKQLENKIRTENKDMKQNDVDKQKELLKRKLFDRFKEILKRRNGEIVFKEVFDEYIKMIKKGTHLKKELTLKTAHHEAVWKAIDKMHQDLPFEQRRDTFQRYHKKITKAYEDTKKRNKKIKIGVTVAGTLVAGGALAAVSAVVPPLLPVIAVVHTLKLTFATTQVLGGAIGFGIGAGTGVIASADFVARECKYNVKKDLLQPLLVALHILFPGAIDLIDVDVFIDKMKTKGENSDEQNNEIDGS